VNLESILNSKGDFVMRMRTLVLATAMVFSGAGVVSAQTVGSAFTYQGTFADNGAPANGNYDFEFVLFTVAQVGTGTAVQTVTKTNVPVSGGLINTTIDFGASTYNGQVKYVEVHVRPSGGGGYTVLSPRQALSAAPYALGLPMPFVRAVNTGSNVAFAIQNNDGGPAIAGVNPSTGTTFPAIHGTAPGGTGVLGDSTTGIGLQGNSASGLGVNGVATALGGTGVRGDARGAGDGVRGLGLIGVHGVGSPGVWAEGGLLATDNISCNVAGSCQSVLNVQNSSIGNLIIGSAGTPSVDVFRVNGNGSVFANGDYNSGGADIAEYVPAIESLQPGDVVEIDAQNGDAFRLSSHSNSTAVAGVISTKPGVSLNNPAGEQSTANGMPRLALSGRVPVKATSENGAIHAGDLLVSSSKPGHAMRAPTSPQAGTVIGKAMQKLDGDSGEIEMLVMLR
jgi:hypothetical protein